MGTHATLEALEAALDRVRRSPRDSGRLEMIVRRPEAEQRIVLDAAELSVERGLHGDNWQARGSKRTADGSAHPDMQVALMNSRVIQEVALERDRWPLAGDQLYVDLDLSEESLPAGQQIALGSAVLEITAMPHKGCKKFVERFGAAAMQWVNAPAHGPLRLRGVYAKVVRSGTIRTGDVLRRI